VPQGFAERLALFPVDCCGRELDGFDVSAALRACIRSSSSNGSCGLSRSSHAIPDGAALLCRALPIFWAHDFLTRLAAGPPRSRSFCVSRERRQHTKRPSSPIFPNFSKRGRGRGEESGINSRTRGDEKDMRRKGGKRRDICGREWPTCTLCVVLS
jgi:hypothetical protein